MCAFDRTKLRKKYRKKYRENRQNGNTEMKIDMEAKTYDSF